MKISRRSLILGGIAATAGAVFAKFIPKSGLLGSYSEIPRSIIGASSNVGHMLRSDNFPAPISTEKKDIVIVGSGIAGLAAGYNLNKSGFNNFTILELENEPCGNSRSGKNNISAYPWGAHYVPLPSEEATEVRELFEELGIITGYKNGLPIYNEYYIVHDPDERLYLYGRWQDGLVPAIGINKTDEAEYKRFFAMMEQFKTLKGSDGRKVFAIPVDKSSNDSKYLALDNVTMTEWLEREGFKSEYLLWYINYCCRDDYGITSKDTSAWAGIHYFAARSGKAANTDSKNVITWPEGNGWLANKLAEPIRSNIATGALTYKVIEENKSVNIEYFDVATQTSKRITAKAVIMATPHFITARLVQSGKYKADGFTYAPWMVANISLRKLPAGRGAALSWDNVIYRSNMLGYVVATHQNLDMKPLKTVLTYYWPLSHTPPEEARKEALAKSIQDWQKIILTELLRVHPELEGHVENIDVCVWGHAMIRPVKGFIWSKNRKEALKQHPPIFTAHSDMAGISIFEEAYTYGINAAKQALKFTRQV